MIPPRSWNRRVLALAGPLFFAGLSTPVLSLVETAVVGHLPRPELLGGVALGTTIFNYVFWAFSFLRLSATGLTAQADGEGRFDRAVDVLLRSFAVALGVGALAVAARGPFTAAALALLEGSPAVEAAAEVYVRLRLLATPAAFGNYAVLGWLLGLGHARLALALEVLRGATQIAALAVLVGRFELPGVAGAAVFAEWLAFAVGLAAVVVVLRRRRRETGAFAPPADRGAAARSALARVFDLGELRRLFATNRDLFVRTGSLLFAFGAFAAGGGELGDEVLGGNAILMNLYLLTSYGLGAFGQAASTLVGHAHGHGDARGVLDAVRHTSRWALGAAAACALAIGAGGPRLVPELSAIASVREVAVGYLPYAAALPLVSFLSFQFDGVAVGAGRTPLLRNVMVAAFVVFVAVRAVFVPAWGNHGLWLAFVGFMATRSVGFLLCLRDLRRAAADRPPTAGASA